VVAEGYRALAASLVAIIIIYRASSPTLSLVPTIILVRTTPRPSAGTLPLPLPRAVLRKSNWFPEFIARQIFPLSSRLHGRPNTRAMVYRYRPGVYARRTTHIRSRYVRDWSIAYKFSTNNKSACGTRCRRPLHIPSAKTVRKREVSRGKVREFFNTFQADDSIAGTFAIASSRTAEYLSKTMFQLLIDSLSFCTVSCNLKVHACVVRSNGKKRLKQFIGWHAKCTIWLFR